MKEKMQQTKLTSKGFMAARQTSPLKKDSWHKNKCTDKQSYTRTTLNMH